MRRGRVEDDYRIVWRDGSRMAGHDPSGMSGGPEGARSAGERMLAGRNSATVTVRLGSGEDRKEPKEFGVIGDHSGNETHQDRCMSP